MDFHLRHGIVHEVIPAEAHHRIGKIERRNALLRSIVERMVDEHGMHSREELNRGLAAALHTINSCTFSHGRSPFQAVFGRVPRPFGDVLSDPMSLIISPDASLQRTEILRAEAMKALAEHSASSSIKRALLRKTRHQQDFKALQPGQPVAFWRWSGRSRQHKRGSWTLARFLSLDPDNKSMWVQVGTTTTKVANNQVRMACGWEEWTPSPEDIAILKNAEANLKDDLWQDGREEPPGVLQEATQELARQPYVRPAPLPERDRDYWRYTEDSAIRMHVSPRYELFIPQRDECDFNLDDLGDMRRTYIQDMPEQPEDDQWRDPRCHREYELPWTGTTTFFWKKNSSERLKVVRDLPATTVPAPALRQGPASSTDDARLQTNVHHEQQQTNVHQEQHQTNSHQEQHQTSVHQELHQSFVDNRSLSFHVPMSPVPPTPRSRRTRSRTPSRPAVKRQTLRQGPEQLQAQVLPDAPSSWPETAQSLTPTPLPVLSDDATNIAPVTESMQHHEASAHEGQELSDPNALRAPQTKPPGSAKSAPPVMTAPVDVEAQPSSLVQLPQKRAADVLYTSGVYKFFCDDFGETILDNVDLYDYEHPYMTDVFYKCYLSSSNRLREMQEANVLEEPDREDASSDDGNMTVSNNRTHSRQELKQLDREIPWRELIGLPRASYEKYLDAVRTESNNWFSWGGIMPVPTKEAHAILNDPVLGRRVLKSRAAYRDKNKGLGEIRAKCRVDLLGCNDPDLFNLTRDSPTPTRLSESIVMAIAAAGANGEVNHDKKLWRLWISDAKSAFLQGEQNLDERAGPLYMKPPRDPLIAETNTFSADLYQVLGNGYGLPDAPRVWSRRVLQRALERGFKQHGFDHCLFYYVNEDEQLRAVMIVRVDDFLCVYHQDFDSDLLQNMFVWGSITIITVNEPGVFRGKEIKLVYEGRYKYKVTQESFIQGLEPGRISKDRSKSDDKLTATEWQEFRSVSGSLQWLASQTRPEISPVVSLSNKGQETSYLDLKRLYETVNHLRDTPDHGLTYQDIPFDSSSTIVTFTDSSWANAELKSQYGVLVMLSPPQVTETTSKGTLLDWKSARSTRICRSTLAAEASAADEGEGADRATFTKLCISEMLYLEPAFKVGCRLNSLQVTDAKSLYDSIVAENPSLTDKRSLINIRSVQQTVSPRQVHWVPTSLMWADALTKLDSSKLLMSFTAWLQNPPYSTSGEF